MFAWLTQKFPQNVIVGGLATSHTSKTLKCLDFIISGQFKDQQDVCPSFLTKLLWDIHFYYLQMVFLFLFEI